MERAARRAAVIAVVATIAVGASATALATSRASGTTYAACVTKSTGALYGVTTKAKPKCKKGDKAISWSQTGPQGPPGAAGSVGASGPPGPAGTTGQTAQTAFGTGTVVAGPSFALVPGLSLTVDVPAGSKAYISTDGGLVNPSSASSSSSTDVVVLVDGNQPATGFYRRIFCLNPPTANTASCTWSMSGVQSLTTGSHTITVQVIQVGGSALAATVSGNSASVNQGELSVLVLKG